MANLCLLWHFHQPYYPDIQTNINSTSSITFRTLQNYYPMAKILQSFPDIRINFNITPTLLKQIKLTSEGEIKDLFLNIFQDNTSISDLLFFYNELPKIFTSNNKTLNHLKEKVETGQYNKKDILDFKVHLHLICFNKILHTEEINYLIQKTRDFNQEDIEILINKEKSIFSIT